VHARVRIFIEGHGRRYHVQESASAALRHLHMKRVGTWMDNQKRKARALPEEKSQNE